uniref:Alpha-1,6-mannosyl-glycoprotein 2-beta-N-acetylglucosaminyltransferase n=1 Tax=Steinernema glaseri TaxID=37863 RepID=A0A1I7YTJ3_9BILA
MEKQVDPDERARTNAWLIYDNPTAALEKGLSTEEIQTAASYLNDHHVILNEDLFGNISGVQVVIIVQVHSRLRYLRGLIESLRATVGIEKALLVFSHDIVAEPLNDLVRSIRFCRVIQIFYPFSVTFFDDVRSNTDLGNYTHLKSDVYPQMKNHWWWKMNYVFDGVVKRYGLEDRHVLRLEEDNYVAPDVLHVLNQLIEQKQS